MPISKATLTASREALRPLLQAHAEAKGVEMLDEGERYYIQLPAGSITAELGGEAITLSLGARLLDHLEGLTAEVGALLAAIEPKPLNWSTAQGPKLHIGRVAQVTDISPNFRRLRLEGEFAAFIEGSMHFRFAIGPEGAELPSNGPKGVEWPGGIEQWHRPPYTVRQMDPEGAWIEIDIFLHEGGRVTEWSAKLALGTPVGIIGPSGRSPRQAGWLGLIGDETALPVVLRAYMAAAEGTKGQAFILVPSREDAQAIDLPEGLELTYVTRDEVARLPDLLERLTPPENNRAIFFAGKREEAEVARAWGKAQGFGAGEFHAGAYWGDEAEASEPRERRERRH